MKANYHTHTMRCHHAVGSDESYVQAAIEAGFDELGFSDHAPWNYRTNYVSPIRMTMDELPGYVQSIQALRGKYQDQIRIRTGLEIEYYPMYMDHYQVLRDAGIEYFILGAHFIGTDEGNPYIGGPRASDELILRYADSVAEALQTGLFRYLAHPDLFMRRRPEEFTKACEEATRVICQAALEADLPLEYNLLGRISQLQGEVCGYPNNHFWAYARSFHNRTILGADAHDPELLKDTSLWNAGHEYLQSLGYRVEDRLDFGD